MYLIWGIPTPPCRILYNLLSYSSWGWRAFFDSNFIASSCRQCGSSRCGSGWCFSFLWVWSVWLVVSIITWLHFGMCGWWGSVLTYIYLIELVVGVVSLYSRIVIVFILNVNISFWCFVEDVVACYI